MPEEPMPGVPDLEQQREQQRLQQAESQAQALAGQTAGDPSEFFEDEDHWDKLSDFDIEREDFPDEMGDVMATELSDKFILGNLPDKHEWYKFGFWAENEVHTMLKEYPDADSNVTGTDYWIMYGRDAGMSEDDAERYVKPPLTDEQTRRFWSAADTKKAGMTLALKGRALRALTEITAVGRTETVEKEDNEGGRLQKLLDRL